MIKKLSIFNLIFIAVLLLSVVLPPLGAFADDVLITSFDEHTIYEDLQGATILGKEFNIEDYPVNSSGAVQLLAFTEYSFSLKHEYQKSYGLYLYVYVPQGGIVDSQKNEVTIADAYNSNGEPSHWTDYKLKLLSKDATDVLYKFKVLDADKEFTIVRIYNRVAMSSNERRYDINGIELHFPENANATNFGIGGTWTITGFDKGMHDSSMEHSTLQSTATFQNTLKLDVHSTYYRYPSGEHVGSDQLSSVYFSVDNSIDQGYDRLYAIDFDAYKYLTSPIFCIYDQFTGNGDLFVNHSKIYSNLLNQRGYTRSELEQIYGEAYLVSTNYTWLSWCHNSWGAPEFDAEYNVEIDRYAWVLQAKKANDYKVSSDTLYDYMKEYSHEFGGTICGQYNSFLFSDEYYCLNAPVFNVTVDHNIGRTILADEVWELRGLNYEDSEVWKLLNFLFQFTPESDNISFSPIQAVTYSDIKSLSNEQISETFLVNEYDVEEFKSYVREQDLLNKTVYLFRFDIDTYISHELLFDDISVCGYVAQEPVYLDFDIISLTYNKAGVQTVLPVVSDPIDVIAGIEPPANTLIDIDGAVSSVLVAVFTLILSIVAIIVFVWIFIRGLKYIFTGK